METKICKYCKKKFTKKDILEKQSENYNINFIDRDFKRRQFCSNECNIKYYGRRAYERKIKYMHKQGFCSICGYKEHPDILEVHHIIARKDGGNDDIDNLILLCPNCHRKVHKGHIGSKELYEYCTKEK